MSDSQLSSKVYLVFFKLLEGFNIIVFLKRKVTGLQFLYKVPGLATVFYLCLEPLRSYHWKPLPNFVLEEGKNLICGVFFSELQ